MGASPKLEKKVQLRFAPQNKTIFVKSTALWEKSYKRKGNAGIDITIFRQGMGRP